MDWYLVIRATVTTAHSSASILDTVSRVESEFHILSLTRHKHSRNRKNIEDLVDRQFLVFLASTLLLLVSIVVDFVHLIENGRVLKEGPLVSDWHLRDVGQHEVLLLAGVVQNASEIDLGRQDLKVGEADLTLESDDVFMGVAIVRDRQLAVDVIGQAVLLHSRVEINLDRLGLVLLKGQLLDWARERLIDFEVDSGSEGSHVLNDELLGLGRGWNTLLPKVLEVKLGV